MKTISKPAALLLALTLALSLMACGDNGRAPDDGGADGDVPSGGDYTALTGDWYLDGDPAAESILSIAAAGSCTSVPAATATPPEWTAGPSGRAGRPACTTPIPRTLTASPTTCRRWTRTCCTGAASTTATSAASER